MNTCKNPDKIYIQPNAHDGWFDGNKPNDNFVEYIRKDALLEWTKTEKLKCSDETHPYAQFMNVVIDKLNSM